MEKKDEKDKDDQEILKLFNGWGLSHDQGIPLAIVAAKMPENLIDTLFDLEGKALKAGKGEKCALFLKEPGLCGRNIWNVLMPFHDFAWLLYAAEQFYLSQKHGRNYQIYGEGKGKPTTTLATQTESSR